MDLRIKDAEKLEAFKIKDQLNNALLSDRCVVVTAAPGAGKSTLLPLTVLEGLRPEGKILMLEPRRIAAMQIAGRMSEMIGQMPGDTVGYRVRFESRISSSTRIEVITERILIRMILDNPTLDGISMIFFDEFHERSLDTDTALALVRRIQSILREDIRIVIMSATIDSSAISDKLGAKVVECSGRSYPVDVIYKDGISFPYYPSNIASSMADAIRNAVKETEGDILAFLPGEAEIMICSDMLSALANTVDIAPLYGMLPFNEQKKAVMPSSDGRRKVVLATSIAETSLTIEGISIVIDSGLTRRMIYDSKSSLSHLETVLISKDMAIQRSGRAGRLGPGKAIRLWTKATEEQMEENRRPEIETADLSSFLLDIAAWGEDIDMLSWITYPPKASTYRGYGLLSSLGATDSENKITKRGLMLSRIPCHARIASMMLEAEKTNMSHLASYIASVLENGLPISEEYPKTANLCAYIELISGSSNAPGISKIRKVAKQFIALAESGANHSGHMEQLSQNDIWAYTGLLLAYAYPERIAHRTGNDGTYHMANGEKARLDLSDELSYYEWICIANMNASQSGRVFIAAPLEKEDIIRLSKTRDNIFWDSKSGQIISRKEWKIGNLLIDQRPLEDIDEEAIKKTIIDAAVKHGTSMLDFNEKTEALQTRIETLRQWHPELGFPSLATEDILRCCNSWLPAFLEKASTVKELKKIELDKAMWTILTYEQQILADRLVPEYVMLPSGKKARLEYRPGAELPILRIRLQECFGMTDTPRIDNGRKAVLMELLSPGFKPVQLTQDLNSFWSGTYQEVRKELRRRYPKHSWPEDPYNIRPEEIKRLYH